MSWSFPKWRSVSHCGCRTLISTSIALSTAWPFTPIRAQSTIVELEAEAGGVISSNPLMLTDGRSALMGEVALHPRIRTEFPTGSMLDFSARVADRQYSRDFGNILVGNAVTEMLFRRNERLSLRGRALIERDVLADRITSGLDAAVSSRAVRAGYGALIGADWRPDVYWEIRPEVHFDGSHYNAAGLFNTRTIGADLSISRRISPYTRLGARFGVDRNRADGVGSFTVASAIFVMSQRFSPHLRGDFELGVQHYGSRPTFAAGVPSVQKGTLNLLNVKGELCHESTRTSACFTTELGSGVTAVGGAERRFVVGGRITHRLAERLSLSASADYQRVKLLESDVPHLRSAQVRLALDHDLGRRLTLGGIAEYRRRETFGAQTVDAGYLGLRLRYRWRRP